MLHGGGRRDVRPQRPSKTVNAPAPCRPASPQPSLRNFSHSIPASSARRSRHSSSAATRRASGWPVTSRERIGGLFLLKNSALSFARRNSWPAGCATILLSERFELDLENKGNPLIAQLGLLIRFAMRHRRRDMAEAP